MGASTDDKLANKDLVARLKKKLGAERKRRAKFEQQLKTGAGNRMMQAAAVFPLTHMGPSRKWPISARNPLRSAIE